MGATARLVVSMATVLAMQLDLIGARSLQRRWVNFPTGTSWVLKSWCNGGECGKATVGSETVVDVNWYYITKEDITELQRQNKVIICYMSAGAAMPLERKKHPDLPYGRKLSGYQLTYFDVRRWPELKTFMQNRLNDAKGKGCDAVELDNIDCWQNDCVSGVKRYQPAMRQAQVEYAKWLSSTAHGLGMAVGMKNSLYLVEDLVHYFDFAVNEQCQEWKECHYLQPFVANGKAVFGTEYAGSPGKICQQARQFGISTKYDFGNGWKSCG